ncbi:hypothetical protein WJX74_009525 [Apatococcus lobatus]|uniref:C2 NT-type domain-containing protein n=1 Tax=Apatococcus lobatus TaxID=904363 RepID=A0AAW1S0A6_9CHLO
MNMFKRKGKATGFDFYLHIHTLYPWPSKYKAVYVEWSRGSSHKGVLKPAGPSSQSSGQVASFDFDEGIHVPCTLYPEGGKSKTGGLGPFGEKWLVLAVYDYGTKSDKPLGNVHLNLAYYSAEDAMAQQSFTVACSPQISAIVGEATMLVTIGCKLKGFKGKATDSASEVDSTDGEYSDISGFATPGSTVGGRSLGPSSRVSPSMGRIEENPQAHREQMELRALQESRRRPAGPPAGTPTRAAKQQRYDEDGILEDDDDDGDDEAMSAPPQQAAPLPRLQASLPGQLAAVPTPPRAPATPNPDADSDEEDFMNAAIAAVEGRGPPPEQVLAEKKASQRVQSIGSGTIPSMGTSRSGSMGQNQLSPVPDPRSRSNASPQVPQRSRRGVSPAQERPPPPSPQPVANQAVSPPPRRSPAEAPLPAVAPLAAVPPLAAAAAGAGSGDRPTRVGPSRWRRTTDESSDGGASRASSQDVSLDGGRVGGRQQQPQSPIPPWDEPSQQQGGRSPVLQDAQQPDRAGSARRAASPAPVSPFNEQGSTSGDSSRASGLSRVSEVTESPGSTAGGGPFAGSYQRNRGAAAAATAAAEPAPAAVGAPRGANAGRAVGSRRPPAPVPASPFVGDDSSGSEEDDIPTPVQPAARGPQGQGGGSGVGRAARHGELANLKSASSLSSNPFLQRDRSSDGGEPPQRELGMGRAAPPNKSPEPVGASGTARQAVPVRGRFVRQFPQRQQEPVLSDVPSVLQDAARGPEPPPLTSRPQEQPPAVQQERPTRKLSFYAQPKPADSQPQPPPQPAAASAIPTGDGVRPGRMQSPVVAAAAGPSPRQAAQSTTTGPLTEMFRGSRQLAEPQPSNLTGRSTNVGRLPEERETGRPSLLNGRRLQSGSETSDSEDEHIEVIEVDQPPTGSIRPQAPQPTPTPSQPAGRGVPGQEPEEEEDEVALAMAAARARRDALSTRAAPSEPGMRPGRMASPARNQSPARQNPPQPAAPLQQAQEESRPRWARTPSPEPVLPLPVSQPTNQSTSRSASPLPAAATPLPPGATPGRLGAAPVSLGQNGFNPRDEAPPPLGPIPMQLGNAGMTEGAAGVGLVQNGFNPPNEGLRGPPPLAPIPARMGTAAGPGLGAAGSGPQSNGLSQQNNEPPPWDTPAISRTRDSSPARGPQVGMHGIEGMPNRPRFEQRGNLAAGQAGQAPRRDSFPNEGEVQEENPFSQPPLQSPLLSASPSVRGGSRMPPSFPSEPPKSYLPSREEPTRTIQRSDSLVDRALDMSWSTYNAEAEAPRHRGQLGAGMAAVREGVPREQDSGDLDNGLGPSSEAAVAPPALPNGMTVADVEAMLVELRTVAALEASVYLARSGKGGARSLRGKAVHAPARRVARTTIMLGPEEGVVFGVRAIRAIEAAADGCSDVVGMAYWWSNCIQLRWMLWAMCHGGGFGDASDGPPIVNEFDWVMKVLVPPLKDLECYIFENINTNLWSNVLVETAMSEAFASVAQSANHSPHHPRISQQELAIHRWHDALAAVNRTLVASGQGAPAGHVELLKQKVVTALLRRLDSSLFAHLVQEDQAAMEDGSSIHRDHFGGQKHNASFDTRASSMKLDSKLLPFPKGPLTFGVGINLKMAVTRWTNWASDIDIKEDLKGIDEGYSLFPRLRATADLLMMPKEVLTDRVTRSEVVPGLPLRRICQILERFEPDDFAPDPLPAGLLDALHQETPPSQPTPSPAAKLDAGYEPPSESSLLADGLIEPVSLELDDDSDDELDAVSEMYDSTQTAPESRGEETQRFQLLKELWSSAR